MFGSKFKPQKIKTMQRRKFMQRSLLASGALFVSAGSAFGGSKTEKIMADEKPFHLNYGIHDGMFKNHAGADFIEQIKFGHSMGFRSIEDNGMMKRSAEQQEKIGKCCS